MSHCYRYVMTNTFSCQICESDIDYSYLGINSYPNKSVHIQSYISACKLQFESLKWDIPFKSYEEYYNIPVTLTEILTNNTDFNN